MNCNNCEQTIETRWSYCPSCGTKTKPKIVEGMTLEDVFLNITNDLKTIFLNTKSLEQKNKQRITKNTNNNNQTLKIAKTRNIKNTQRKITKKIPKTILEPKTTILEKRAGKFKVKLHLPTIISLKTIELESFEESCEIRAHAKNKMYFTIIKIPTNLQLKTKTLKQENLTLTFSL